MDQYVEGRKQLWLSKYRRAVNEDVFTTLKGTIKLVAGLYNSRVAGKLAAAIVAELSAPAPWPRLPYLALYKVQLESWVSVTTRLLRNASQDAVLADTLSKQVLPDELASAIAKYHSGRDVRRMLRANRIVLPALQAWTGQVMANTFGVPETGTAPTQQAWNAVVNLLGTPIEVASLQRNREQHLEAYQRVLSDMRHALAPLRQRGLSTIALLEAATTPASRKAQGLQMLDTLTTMFQVSLIMILNIGGIVAQEAFHTDHLVNGKVLWDVVYENVLHHHISAVHYNVCRRTYYIIWWCLRLWRSVDETFVAPHAHVAISSSLLVRREQQELIDARTRVKRMMAEMSAPARNMIGPGGTGPLDVAFVAPGNNSNDAHDDDDDDAVAAARLIVLPDRWGERLMAAAAGDKHRERWRQHYERLRQQTDIIGDTMYVDSSNSNSNRS